MENCTFNTKVFYGDIAVVQHVYLFTSDVTDKNILGGKGAGLSTMTSLGLPIPQGLTISTATCIEFLNNGGKYPDGVWDEIVENLHRVEEITGKKFGDVENPLLVSVRSGARISMPGMMDTVLNTGLTDEIIESIAAKTGNRRFVLDSYRRLIYMFANVVMGLSIDKFEEILKSTKEQHNLQSDYELTVEMLASIISKYKVIFEEEAGMPFPQDPLVQLDLAIKAVFNSWNNKRAINYRNFEGIPHDIGTAVNIQEMVFGNYDDNSGTGVMFTRNPASGANEIYGEFLMNAQGEDVVAGIRTPIPISKLKEQNLEIYQQLSDIAHKLEQHYRDMQDMEFTIERNKLFLLQTRTGKRTGTAAAKIAYDLVQEGLITKNEAVLRIQPRDIESSLFPSVVWKDKKHLFFFDIPDLTTRLQEESFQDIVASADVKKTHVLGEGLPAGPGAASGHIIFASDLAEALVAGTTTPDFEVKYTHKRKGVEVPNLILVKDETSPEDFHGMVASMGILTLRGGMTSHAALVGRQIGKRVIVGAASSGLVINGTTLKTKSGDVLQQGDVISIEVFEKGMVYADHLTIMTPTKLMDELETILDWSDDLAKIKVRANADKQNDTQNAIDYGATGTGLARTEHQFFDALSIMQKMILAKNQDERLEALGEMEKLQIKDFTDLFTVATGKPVTIRLLDPPLHEFLPSELELREKLWKGGLSDAEKAEIETILEKVMYYQEANPMLGLRGVRLGLLFPEVTEMQTRAIITAALDARENGKDPHPEIMIPLIGSAEEFKRSREIVDRVAQEVFTQRNHTIDYHVGTMIEIPRAALTADEIAAGKLGADFFSFGTNDLHQMSFGFSRDDIGKFLPFYLDNKIIPADPFQTIDQTGVGKLMQMTVELGRAAGEQAGKYVKIGICGEQGGEPNSIDFCYRIGLDYVSCSPFRVPIARLAAAHATLKNPEPDAKYRKKL